MNTTRTIVARGLVRAAGIPSRGMSNVHPGYKHMKEIQKQWTYGDGVPIHVKGGAFDKAMFIGTLTMCAVGLGLVSNAAFSLIFPKKKE